MMSTVYLGHGVLCYHKLRLKGALTFHFDFWSLRASNMEYGTIDDGNKLWEAVEKVSHQQSRFKITINFGDWQQGQIDFVRMKGPFLSKLKEECQEMGLEAVDVTLEFEFKDWKCKFDLNLKDVKKWTGVLQTLGGWGRSQVWVWRRIMTMHTTQDHAPMILKVRTKENDASDSSNRRNSMGRKLEAEGIPNDFGLIAKNGKRIACHRKVLEAYSPVFASLFGHRCRDSIEGYCELKVSENVLNELRQYLYYGELDRAETDQLLAYDMLEIAHMYEITCLESILKNMLLAQLGTPGLDNDVNMMLLLYCFVSRVGDEYRDVKDQLLALIQSKQSKEIWKSEVYGCIEEKDINLARKIACWFDNEELDSSEDDFFMC